MQTVFKLDTDIYALKLRLQEGWKVVFVINTNDLGTYLILEKR